jgi:prepilin-type N-terminal cleavage/methylation domain-containing protein
LRNSPCGVTLIETMIAVVISLIIMALVGGVIFTATVQNKNQGLEMSRVTVYSQDKIEKLMNLDWISCTSVPPGAGCNTTGLNAPEWNKGLNAGGTLAWQPGCPASGPAMGYMDFLDTNGNQFAGTSCSAVGNYAYQRQWQVTDVVPPSPGVPALKRVDVLVWSRNAVNTGSAAPSALLTTYVSE